MKEKPKILLVNDDGAEAPGLWTLYDHLAEFAEPRVVAPTREQSGRGHAVTIRERMAMAELRRDGKTAGYRLDGMPADCVKLALAELWPDQISLVISGINAGSNTGFNILYSGTVAAALEAAIYGLPALAVSLRDVDGPPTHFATAAQIAVPLVRDVLDRGLPKDVILNVNVPDVPVEQIEGTVVTRQGRECYIDVFKRNGDREEAAWCMNVGGERLHSPDSDTSLDDLTLFERRVSITPLHFDWTCDSAIDGLRDRFSRLPPP